MNRQIDWAGVGQDERLLQGERIVCAARQRPECGRGEELKEGRWAGEGRSLTSLLWHHSLH